MSTIIKENKNKTDVSSRTIRGPTSMYLDRALWTLARKTALDLGITATEFVEKALRNEIAKGVQKS